jgi:opacity protein-like surface antigen
VKKIIALLTLATVAAIPLAASAADATVYADVLSAYVYNGQVGNDEAVFEPGLDVSGPLGLGYSLWANMDLTDNPSSWGPNSGGKWSEIDLGLNWTLPGDGPVGLTVGGIYYVYPQKKSDVETNENGTVASVADAPADGSYEGYVKVTAQNILLQPAVKFCHDMDDQEDWIALFSINHTFSLTDALSLNLGAILGYAGEYYVESNYGSDVGAAFTHYQLDAGLNFAMTEKVSVGLKGSYSSIIDGDVRDAIESTDLYPEVDLFYGGVNLSCSF